MIEKHELDAIETRAHALRVTMPQICRIAGKHPQSWYRAKARGRAEYTLIKPIESTLDDLERGANPDRMAS